MGPSRTLFMAVWHPTLQPGWPSGLLSPPTTTPAWGICPAVLAGTGLHTPSPLPLP